jgi:hypothetical protein
VVQHLQQFAPTVWRHFASDAFTSAQSEAQRLELLKTTVALRRESYPALYASADEIAAILALGVPVELYQGPDDGSLNAALLFQPDRARVVLFGQLQEKLAPDELRALLGHELAHHRLWTLDQGAVLIAGNALQCLAAMQGLESVENTLRLFALSTEVFADRAGLQVSSLHAAVGCLIKVRTGLSNVVVTDFIEQSQELLAAEDLGSRGWTHPEAHIRTLALAWYERDGEDSNPAIRRLLEGPIQLDDLDLLRREELSALVRQLIDTLLVPEWFRTEAVLGHCRLFFDDYQVSPVDQWGDPESLVAPWGESVREFLVHVLVDCVAVDPELHDLPLLQAHATAEKLGMAERFERAVNKKLRRTRKSIREDLADRDARLALEGP